MLDDLSAFWAHSAAQFKDISSVIGYEIMNEPFAGNFYADPLLLVPGVAGGKNLARMHDAVAKAIRKEDDRHILFFEPVTWGMIFNGKIVGSGYDHVPGGSEYMNRSAFSYHYYCATFDSKYNNQPNIRKVICDDIVGPLVFKAVHADLQKFGGAAMMTEGLACNEDSPTEQGPGNECQVVMGKLDTNLFSWTDYGVSQGADWNPSPKQQEMWARSYAQAVAGKPLNMTFNPQTKDFSVCFSVDTSIQAPTEIFASLFYSYNTSRVIKTTSNLQVQDNSTDIVKIIPTANALSGANGCVYITK
jgi:endoglycosylceramidase